MTAAVVHTLAIGAASVCGLMLILWLLHLPLRDAATEAQALRSKGDDYRRYQQTTSAFVPWFPRS
jgi:steroid 5-alpha reductase family enzyme